MLDLRKLFNSKHLKSKPEEALLVALNIPCEWFSIFIERGNRQKKKIMVPKDDFKEALRIVARDFQSKAHCHDSVFSYRKGLSFYDLAQEHKEKHFLLKTDLSNFFDSIDQQAVLETLRRYYDDAALAQRIAHFVCHEGKLPFGSPFSPYFSNIHLRKMDHYLFHTCRNVGAVYTRYSDDILISADEKDMLEKIIEELPSFLSRHYPSLKLNQLKTKIEAAPFHAGPFTVHKKAEIKLCKSHKRLIRVRLHKYSILELPDDEIPSLKGSLLFLKGNDPNYFQLLKEKFPLEIEELF